MKILILGGSGMLGHQLWRHLHSRYDTWVTLRRSGAEFSPYELFEPDHVVEGLDIADIDRVRRVIERVEPDAVLNGVGIVKQLKAAKDPIPSIAINALFPHRLAELCAAAGARLILFSTDCVFSGKRGNYIETDVSDAEDLYGRTKFLGEVADSPHVLTLRSSIVGRELGSAHSLVDWFLAQEGSRVRGFRRAIYTGFTTMEMARIVDLVLTSFPRMSGLWHVASEPINKFDLLLLVRASFGLEIEIEPQDEFVCDRSLVGSRFNLTTGYGPPSWTSMIEEMAALRDKR